MSAIFSLGLTYFYSRNFLPPGNEEWHSLIGIAFQFEYLHFVDTSFLEGYYFFQYLINMLNM